MTHHSFLQTLRARGLRAWQANFVASFLKADSAAYHLLLAPPGSGKSHACVTIAAELAERGAKRILVLAPLTALCDQWHAQLDRAQSTLPVVFLTRQVFREMQAASQTGVSTLDAAGIYVTSQDFAKQEDVAASLSAVNWDLVIVDEAHRVSSPQRGALLEEMARTKTIQRLLLLTATPHANLESWIQPAFNQEGGASAPIAVTNWYDALQDWSGVAIERQRVRWSVVPYKRSSDEVRFLSELLNLLPRLTAATNENVRLPQSLTRRASSSLFAIEQSLQRIVSGQHESERGYDESNQPVATSDAQGTSDSTFGVSDKVVGEVSSAQWEPDPGVREIESATQSIAGRWSDLVAGVALAKQCLDALDQVTNDEKLNAFRGLMSSITNASSEGIPRIVVFSMFADTASYLYSALGEMSIPSLKVLGSSSFTTRQATIEQFMRQGGVLVGTDGAISEGFDLEQVSHVVHYELPSTSFALARRCGRFDRLGRTAPLTMYVLKDESEVLQLESRQIEQLVSHEHSTADSR